MGLRWNPETLSNLFLAKSGPAMNADPFSVTIPSLHTPRHHRAWPSLKSPPKSQISLSLCGAPGYLHGWLWWLEVFIVHRYLMTRGFAVLAIFNITRSLSHLCSLAWFSQLFSNWSVQIKFVLSLFVLTCSLFLFSVRRSSWQRSTTVSPCWFSGSRWSREYCTPCWEQGKMLWTSAKT